MVVTEQAVWLLDQQHDTVGVPARFEDMLSLAVEDASRFTVTRIMLLGIGGLGLKKQQAILSFSTRWNGKVTTDWFSVNYVPLARVLATLSAIPAAARLLGRGSSSAEGTTRPTVAERIAELEQLRDQGVIGDDEYERERKRILADL